MKTISHKILPIGFGVLATLPVFAIEPPKDDAPPPPSVKTAASAPAPEISKLKEAPAKEETAFIGISSAEVPEILAAHLGPEASKGVMIRDLVPGGPAEKAGFTKYDIVTRVSGKSVSSPAELSLRISENKPGDEISIDLIHEGKPSSKTVKLEARPASMTMVDPRQLGHLDFDGMPEEQANRIRDMIEGRMSGRLPDTSQREPENPGRSRFNFQSNATFRLMDEKGTVEMKSSNGSKEITVRDRDKNVTWSGPWNSEDDKKAAPADVRERIERFDFDKGLRGGGLRLRMGKTAQDHSSDE